MKPDPVIDIHAHVILPDCQALDKVVGEHSDRFVAAEELDVPITLHPNGFTNRMGNPLDTTVALGRIIHGGVLEEHPDHVLIGTDHPFDMGHYDPLGQIAGVTGLSDEDRAAIQSTTAARLLKI